MKVLFGLVVLVLLATPVFACNGHGALMPDGNVVAIAGDNVPPGGQLVVDQNYENATHGNRAFAGNHNGVNWYYFFGAPAQPPAPRAEEQDHDYNG